MDKLLANDIFARLLALALAVLIYVQVAGQGGAVTVQRTVTDIPVNVAGLPSGLTVDSITPKTVAITVSGSGGGIGALAPGLLQATVNLTAATVGSGHYYVVAHVPVGVQYLRSTPQDVKVIVEKVEVVNTSVQIDLTGTVPPGYGVGTPVVPQKLVVLMGPQSALAQVVQTVIEVSVQGRTSTVTADLRPVPLNKNGQPVANVQVVPAHVSVSVPVAALPASSVRVQPQTTGSPAAGYRVTSVTANPAAVTITGSVGSAPLRTRPLSVAGAKGSVHGTEAVLLPSGATSAAPSSVEVTATIAPSG